MMDKEIKIFINRRKNTSTIDGETIFGAISPRVHEYFVWKDKQYIITEVRYGYWKYEAIATLKEEYDRKTTIARDLL